MDGVTPATSGQLTLYPHVLETDDERERVSAELGRLRVPENRHAPDTNWIELAFVRLPSPAAQPLPPVILLAGGPGGAGIDEFLRWSEALPWLLRLRETCDVIALDQRGVGLSRPRLECPFRWNLPNDRPGSREELVRVARERSRACAAFWHERGVDLGGYTTEQSADDIDDLRRALGYERISLWGASYGSHLALATVRRHGDHIHRAVIALVEGPDHTYKLPSNIQRQIEQIGRLVRADAELAVAIPDFLALMRSVLARLDQEPVTVEVIDPRDGEAVAVTVGSFDLQRVTAGGLGDREFISRLPARYHALAQGDFRWLALETLKRRTDWFDSAMTWQMDCASWATAERLDQIRREASETLLGDAINGPFPDACDAWGSPDLGDEFRAPIESDVAVLFVSGTLDGRTPVSNAEEVMAGFRNARHLIVENGDHDYHLDVATIADPMLRFLTTGTIETDCVSISFRFAPLTEPGQ